MKEIVLKIKKYQDKKYALFQSKLIPTIDKKTIIGVKTVYLRMIAKDLLNKDAKKANLFLNELPHKYFDENQLHTFMLSEIKDFDLCIEKVNSFLPYIDNWATCDQLIPKVFKKNKDKLFEFIKIWIKSKKAYTVRFAIKMLMNFYLDEDFDIKYIKMVERVNFKSKIKKYKNNNELINISVDPDKYYVEMMRAWFFATALSKQFEKVIYVLKDNKLSIWTHKMTIKKAIESYRITEKQKLQLKKYI